MTQIHYGTNPSAYVGVKPTTPPQFEVHPRAPTNNDYLNFDVGTIWLNTARLHQSPPLNPTNEDIWMLVSKNRGVSGQNAQWVNFGGGDLETLTGNSGGAVSPDAADNINTIGDGVGITVVGNPGTNTLTWSLVGGGVSAQSFPTDVNTATPTAAGVLNIRTQTATQGCGSSVSFSAAPAAPANTVQLNVSDASNNTIIGNGAGNATLTSTNVTSLGDSAVTALTTGSNACLFGFQAGNVYTTESNNVVIGAAQVGRVGEANVIRVGTLGGAAGNSNIFIGRDSGNNTYTTATAVSNTGVGAAVLGAITTANENVSIGASSGTALTTGENNTLVGFQAGNLYTTENNNIVLGTGNTGRVGESNTIRIATYGQAAVTNNVFVGQGAGNLTYTVASAVSNTFVGTNTGAATTTGTGNCAYGTNALAGITTGSNNTAIGGTAATNLTTGSSNVAIGSSALSGAGFTGSSNVTIGASTGGSYTGTESTNIIINHTGVVGDSNITRIGTTVSKCFIAGIRGVTTDAADAIAVLISSTGQLGTISSSRRFKDHIKDMGTDSNALMELRPVTFNFKNDVTKSKQVGLIAEEVEEILPRLVVHDEEGLPLSVKYHDLPVLLLNELQKLSRRVEELEKNCKCKS